MASSKKAHAQQRVQKQAKVVKKVHKKKRVAMHKKAKKLSKAQQRAKLLMKSMMSEAKAAVKHVPKKKTVRKAKAAVHKVKAVRKKKVKAPAASPVSSILGNLMASRKKAHAQQRVQKQAKVVKKV